MQYSHAGGMVVVVLAMAVLVLLCRWVFSTTSRDQRTSRRLEMLRSRGDYGLLVPVTTARTEADGEVLREVLREAGIRATVAPGEAPGERVVLVFRDDAVRARTLVSS